MWVAMSAAEREEFLADVGMAGGGERRYGQHCGPGAGRPGLVQLPAWRAADGSDWPVMSIE